EPQPHWGCLSCAAFPKVARFSQPWALSRNPFGIHHRNFSKTLALGLTLAWLVAMPPVYSAEPLRVAPANPVEKSAAPEKSSPSSPEVRSYLFLHQGMNQGYSSEEVDPEDIDAYFWHIF